MILKNKSLDERCLEIYEEDMINGGKVLILTVYCTKIDNGVWQLPAPQVYNETVYFNYKDKYDKQILAFRNDCQNITAEIGSILSSEIENLKLEIDTTQNALNEILFSKGEV